MIDNMYSIKEASKLLDCSTQNIYRQKSELISKGLMEQSNTGSYFLNEKGINFLREKRIRTMKEQSKDLSSVANKELESIASPTGANASTDIVEILKQQIQDLKEEKEYWKKEYEKKDQELTKTNEHLQNMNTTVFQRLLATEEENRKQATETKKGFFKKWFS